MSKNYYFVPQYTPEMKLANVQAVLAGEFDKLVRPDKIMISHSCGSYRDTMVGYDATRNPCRSMPALRIASMSDLRKFLRDTPGHVEDEYGTIFTTPDYFRSVHESCCVPFEPHLDRETAETIHSEGLPFWFRDFC